MNFARVLFFVCACFMALATVSAAPGNFFKDLEKMGQRVRDAVISAGPAVDVVGKAALLSKGK